MFTDYDRNYQQLKTFETLKEALGLKPYIVKDTEGLEYFSDGTGCGFSSMKESNEGMDCTSGIYNQKRKTISQIKAVSWYVYWQTKSLKSVKAYHDRVRKLIKENKLKVKNE